MAQGKALPYGVYDSGQNRAVVNDYETGIEESDEPLEEIRLLRHSVHPTWNDTISPRERK